MKRTWPQEPEKQSHRDLSLVRMKWWLIINSYGSEWTLFTVTPKAIYFEAARKSVKTDLSDIITAEMKHFLPFLCEWRAALSRSYAALVFLYLFLSVNARTHFSSPSFTQSGNIGAAAPGPVISLFFCLTPMLLLFLYITSLVFLSLSSPWQWNTVTQISGVPWQQNKAVWLSHFPATEHPECQHFHLVLPTAPLFLFSSWFRFAHALLPPSLFSHPPSLTLQEDGSVKDKGQTKSTFPWTSVMYRCLPARSGAPFYVWFLCQRQGNATSSCLRMPCYKTLQNAAAELKIQQMLQTLHCVVTKRWHTFSLGREAHT